MKKFLLTIIVTLFLAGVVIAQPAKGVMGQNSSKFIEHQVGPDRCSSIFSFYNACPESPDGNTIAYVRCTKEPYGRSELVSGELWLCDRNLQHHRKLTDIAGTVAHNGVEAQWIDNNRIAFLDNGVVHLINIHTGRNILKKQLKADGLGHEPFHNKILYNIYTNDGKCEPGMYELDCNTQQTRLILKVKDCEKVKFPSYLPQKDIDSIKNWRTLHSHYSPDGKKIAFRLDVGSGENTQLLGICNIDGSGLQVMNKSLHFCWYDDTSIIGHFQVDKNGLKPIEYEKRYSLTRFDLEGNMVQEMMTPPGNHLAMSPDKQHFVSETFYQTNPVVIKYYTIGHREKIITIASFDPYDVMWKRRFHANPSFSRDGKRVYYSRPLNEKYAGIFYCEIK